jgi:phage terminase large subunit-like protein
MFDEGKADRAVRFIQRLKHTKGRFAGVPFLLQDWQRKIVSEIFGTVKEDGYRQYKTAYVEIPRKNGKSELAAAIALKLLFADDEMGGEIYGAAADTDQASIVFNVAVNMVQQAPGLAKRCKIIESTRRIIVPSTNSVYRVLSADHATKHGFNAHGVVFDELHTQPNEKLWEVLTTSGGTRAQPLVFAITTAGYDRNSVCWHMHEHALQVLNGVLDDKTFYPVVFSAEETEDWKDEAVWYKANPALGTFRDIEEMREFFVRAQQMPIFQNTFKRLYLNQWTKQEDRWLDLDAWDACGADQYEEDIEGTAAWAGLDLASTTDIAAFVVVVPDSDGTYSVLPYFFVPKERVNERAVRDRVPYDLWVKQGFIEETPGNVIDYRYIRKRINEVGQQFNIREIAFDRWGATEIMQSLDDDGFTVVQFGQGFASMAHPTKELLRLVLDKKIRHGGNTVLRWMADNMTVKQDPAGNVKPDKSKSSEKIDGVVALIMALDRALRAEGASVYDERGILTL